jgi:integrase/recombinase XerD
MARIKMKRPAEAITLESAFKEFVIAQSAKGVAEKTLKTYHSHFHAAGKHIDTEKTFAELQKYDLDQMVMSMREAGLAHNSISSYMRVMRTFLKWSKEQGYTTLDVPNIQDKETLKETYTDDELAQLLKKPSNTCDFSEYRNWVIVNFLLNCGCRAATIRHIRNCDVDLSAQQVFFRHTKTGKIQLIPLCSAMNSILADYMEIRGGGTEDYLFSNDFGEMMTENSLRSAIYRYNKHRGVQKTSIHLFRHTFARKYLVDCGGDAFTLQRLLGHSTLDMTKHYCSIFDADIVKNFDQFSPLAQMSKTKEKVLMKR